MSDELKRCPACYGSGRRNRKRCPMCRGSGRVFEEEPAPILADVDEPAVHVLALLCSKCGRMPAPSDEARAKRYKPSQLRGPMTCGKCYEGTLEFETEPAAPETRT